MPTLRSIFAQNVEGMEIILIDDGSTDGTAALLAEIERPDVVVIRQPNSGGPSVPRNVGIKAAKGKYIALFDSDDLMLPSKIAKSLDALAAEPNVGMIFTDFEIIDEAGHTISSSAHEAYDALRGISKVSVGRGVYKIAQDAIFDAMVRQNFVGTSSVVFPRSIFDKIGFFDETLTNGDDRDMWHRIMSRFSALYIPEVLHCYRIRGGSVSTRGARNSENRITVLKKLIKPSLSKENLCLVKAQIARNFYDASYIYYKRHQWNKLLRSLSGYFFYQFQVRICKVLGGNK